MIEDELHVGAGSDEIASEAELARLYAYVEDEPMWREAAEVVAEDVAGRELVGIGLQQAADAADARLGQHALEMPGEIDVLGPGVGDGADDARIEAEDEACLILHLLHRDVDLHVQRRLDAQRFGFAEIGRGVPLALQRRDADASARAESRLVM